MDYVIPRIYLSISLYFINNDNFLFYTVMKFDTNVSDEVLNKRNKTKYIFKTQYIDNSYYGLFKTF